jgi:hypothetical protein
MNNDEAERLCYRVDLTLELVTVRGSFRISRWQ